MSTSTHNIKICSSCSGTGIIIKSEKKRCSMCNGIKRSCEICDSIGFLLTKNSIRCYTCGGLGYK